MLNRLIQFAFEMLLRLAAMFDHVPVPRAQRWKTIQEGWTESSSQSMNVALWVLGLLVVGSIVFAVVHTRREQAKRREREFNYFLRKAEEKELDQQQVKFLARIVRTTGLDQPYRVLDSFDIFQHCCETFEGRQNFSEQEHQHFHQQVDKIKEELGFNKIEEVVPLDSSRDIRTGQTVKIRLPKDGHEYEFDSAVLENEEKFISLDASGMDLDFLGIGFDTTLDITFQRESDAGYSLLTTIARAPDAQKKILFLKHPARLVRNQARHFSRMEVTFPFGYHHIAKDRFDTVEIDSNLTLCENRPVFRADTTDISGGGIAFLTHRRVSKGDYLYLNFQKLSEEHTEPLLAEVVWCEKDGGLKVRRVRARFCNITEKMQDALMKFVYQMQRRFARRLKFAPKR